MSDVNFDRYPSCLSWQVSNKNRGRTADRTCSIVYWPLQGVHVRGGNVLEPIIRIYKQNRKTLYNLSDVYKRLRLWYDFFTPLNIRIMIRFVLKKCIRLCLPSEDRIATVFSGDSSRFEK